MLAWRVAVVAVLVPYLAWAQLATGAQDLAAEECECSPACEDAGEGACRARLRTREDCPCCQVCARQEGDRCAPPAVPCDTELGLFCSPDGVCKGKSLLFLTDYCSSSFKAKSGAYAIVARDLGAHRLFGP